MMSHIEMEYAKTLRDLAEAQAEIVRLKGEAQYGATFVQRAIDAERELAEAKKDAERYRWMRERHENTVMDIYNSISPAMKPELLDATIDAAMKEGGK